jgi:hypothetical protein
MEFNGNAEGAGSGGSDQIILLDILAVDFKVNFALSD